MSAVHQLYDFVSLISACCYMDPSRNLNQSIQSSRKPEFFKTKTQFAFGNAFPSMVLINILLLVLKLEINSRSMMTSQHIWFLHHWSRSNGICEECPVIKRNNAKRGRNHNLLQPKIWLIFQPPFFKLQTQIESCPFYLVATDHPLPSVPPNLFAAGANHLGLPVPRTFLSIRGYFWPKNRLWVLARHSFSDFEFSDFGQRI